jgi:uncharacterized protein
MSIKSVLCPYILAIDFGIDRRSIVLIIFTSKIFSLFGINMLKEQIIKTIRTDKPEIEALYGVRRIGLFGSQVSGRARKKSDIDILVTFNREIDLFEFLELREFLENRLHSKVDLVMESALKPAIGKHILSQVEYV